LNTPQAGTIPCSTERSIEHLAHAISSRFPTLGRLRRLRFQGLEAAPAAGPVYDTGPDAGRSLQRERLFPILLLLPFGSLNMAMKTEVQEAVS